jgi:hypothetical protein
MRHYRVSQGFAAQEGAGQPPTGRLTPMLPERHVFESAVRPPSVAVAAVYAAPATGIAPHGSFNGISTVEKALFLHHGI